MSWEINYNNLVYNFKGPTSSKGFTEFRGLMYTYDQVRKDNSPTTRRRTKKIKSELGQIKLRDREQKWQKQIDTIKNIKHLYDSGQKNYWLTQL